MPEQGRPGRRLGNQEPAGESRVRRSAVAQQLDKRRSSDDVGIFRVVGEMDQRSIRLDLLARFRRRPEQRRVRPKHQRFHEGGIEHAWSMDETDILQLRGKFAGKD